LRYADMERYLALSRVVTGEVMASAFGEWRRQGSTCAGAIVWFFRDLWPGAGWGVVDSNNIPKAAWHYLRRALAPVALFLTNEGVNGLALHAVNDSPAAVHASITLTLYRHGEKAVAEAAQQIELPARGSLQLRGDAMFGHFLDTTYTYRFGPPGHDVVHAVMRDAVSGRVLGSDFFFPLGHAFAVQPELGLEAGARRIGADRFEVTVRSRRFAQAVCIEAPGYSVSHNYFHLAPGAEQQIQLAAKQPGARLRATLQALNASERVKLVWIEPEPSR
jgi:beta-mannosidase